MNASQIITEDMSLEEKLAAIDQAMANAIESASQSGNLDAPIDPASLTICDGCE